MHQQIYLFLSQLFHSLQEQNPYGTPTSVHVLSYEIGFSIDSPYNHPFLKCLKSSNSELPYFSLLAFCAFVGS